MSNEQTIFSKFEELAAFWPSAMSDLKLLDRCTPIINFIAMRWSSEEIEALNRSSNAPRAAMSKSHRLVRFIAHDADANDRLDSDDVENALGLAWTLDEALGRLGTEQSAEITQGAA